MGQVEEKRLSKREAYNIYIYIYTLQDGLDETLAIVDRQEDHHFIKNLDTMNAELIFNSMISCYEKFQELIIAMNKENIEWRTEPTVKLMHECVHKTDTLFKKLEKLKLPPLILLDMEERKAGLFPKLHAELEKKPKNKSNKKNIIG